MQTSPYASGTTDDGGLGEGTRKSGCPKTRRLGRICGDSRLLSRGRSSALQVVNDSAAPGPTHAGLYPSRVSGSMAGELEVESAFAGALLTRKPAL